MRSVQRLPGNAPAADRDGALCRIAAFAVGAVAFVLYRATMLPGLDFGDSASLQATVGSPVLTPRSGYPLYFAIGALLLKATAAAPAHVMNLASAIEAAGACGLFVLVASRLTGSIAASISGGLLFAASYTFWSQAVTAEVYALHLCFVLASIILILRWETQPSLGRLAAFFCVYAIGFGNHLSMILLLPGFTLFLVAAGPEGWRTVVSVRVVALAAAIAAAGACQYLWNFRSLWLLPDPPASLADALRAFWFDVTKSDWRDTMVLNVPRSLIVDHAAMYWFDLRQQFGIAAVAIAGIGAAALWSWNRRRALLIGVLFAVNAAFAFAYNVGDTHVFYLPSHLMVALLATCGVTGIGSAAARFRRLGPILAATALGVYAGVRAYHDFPALDRSRDTRAERLLQAFAGDLDDQRAIALVDLNWQIGNGLSYFMKAVRPQVAAVRLRDVLLYAPALIRDNVEHGRDVVLTAQAADVLRGSYGPLFDVRMERVPRTLQRTTASLAPGTRYVLCILAPTRDAQLDRTDLQAALQSLGVEGVAATESYVAVAGIAGSRPALVAASNRPFTRTVDLAGVRTEIRMESWLSADTIRRMGFGHVVAAHHHTLIVERGVSFVAFEADGVPTVAAYAGNIYAELPRFVIPASPSPMRVEAAVATNR